MLSNQESTFEVFRIINLTIPCHITDGKGGKNGIILCVMCTKRNKNSKNPFSGHHSIIHGMLSLKEDISFTAI